MPDLAGPIQSIELASWLWLILALPLLGAVANAVYGSGFASQVARAIQAGLADEEAPKSRPRVPLTTDQCARIATVSLALSAVAAVVHAALLVGKSFLIQHLWQLVRVGQLDVSLGLAFDPLAAALVLFVTLVGTVVAVRAARPGALATESAWRFFASLCALVFSLVLAFVASNVLVVLIAWQGVALSGLGLSDGAMSRASSGRVLLARRAGDVALLLGVALLFWALGGMWTRDGDYQADLDPRMAAVSVGESTPSKEDPTLRGGAATRGKGLLTVTGLPGSLVYVDGSRTPLLDATGLPLETPFRRHEIDGGAHMFRVAPDDGFRVATHEGRSSFILRGGVLTNYIVARIAIGGDREVALAVMGPTLDFREIFDQLVVADAKGAYPVRDHLTRRKLAGISVVTVACLLLLLGASAKGAELLIEPPDASATRAGLRAAWLQGAAMLLTAVYLMARLIPLLGLSSVAAGAAGLVAVGVVLFGGLLVVRRRRARST
jgi:NADH-quinone oxidoreductase subunit L